MNTLSVFGTKTVEFQYGVNEKYEYFYAGVTLSQNEMTIEKGEEAQLTVNAVIEDDSEYKVKFNSSDESIATVDEIFGKRKPGEEFEKANYLQRYW